MWSNRLTQNEYIHHLSRAIYTIQLWTDARDLSDSTIRTVADKGFKTIFSNWDATYLDCGAGGWVKEGNNWCSPYKGWQLMHQNDLDLILERHGVSNIAEAKDNVLGGEVAMWTEQVDDTELVSKTEPRLSAFAERLW